MFFLDGEDLFDHAARGRILVAEPADDLAVAGDRDAFGDEVFFDHVDQALGAIARPAKVYFVSALPKTRSGKIMRRTLLALCEGEPVGDISTIEDRKPLDDIEKLINS